MTKTIITTIAGAAIALTAFTAMPAKADFKGDNSPGFSQTAASFFSWDPAGIDRPMSRDIDVGQQRSWPTPVCSSPRPSARQQFFLRPASMAPEPLPAVIGTDLAVRP